MSSDQAQHRGYTARHSSAPRVFPFLLVFAAGMSTMSLEFLAARIIAPYYGTSFVVWIILIGLFLASMSAGSISGGYIAEKKHPHPGLLILAGGVDIMLVAALKEPFLLLLQDLVPSIIWGTLLAAFLLFVLPVFLLSVCVPVSLHFAKKHASFRESDVGIIYGISSLGSILGVALIPLLLPALGNTLYTALLGALLCIVSIPGWKANRRFAAVAGTVALSASLLHPLNSRTLDRLLLADRDSLYNRIWIHRDRVGDEPALILRTGRFTPQSIYFPDKPDRYIDYVEKMARFLSPLPVKGRILVLGGGGMQSTLLLSRLNPDAIIDVVEIDPLMPDLALRYFKHSPLENAIIHYTDARTFVKTRLPESYDAIFVDVFSEGGNPPSHMLTLEFAQELARITKPNGIAALNVAARGNEALLTQYASYHAAFGNADLYALNAPGQKNLGVLLASRSPFERQNTGGLYGKITLPSPVPPPLIDDKAPLFINGEYAETPLGIDVIKEYGKTLKEVFGALI